MAFREDLKKKMCLNPRETFLNISVHILNISVHSHLLEVIITTPFTASAVNPVIFLSPRGIRSALKNI